MKICFYANLRAITKQATINLNDSGVNTFRQLIGRLLESYPDIRPHLLEKNGDIRPDVPIFINGRNPRLERMYFDISLHQDDVISIFSPIASGKMNVEVMRDPPRDHLE